MWSRFLVSDYFVVGVAAPLLNILILDATTNSAGESHFFSSAAMWFSKISRSRWPGWACFHGHVRADSVLEAGSPNRLRTRNHAVVYSLFDMFERTGHSGAFPSF